MYRQASMVLCCCVPALLALLLGACAAAPIYPASYASTAATPRQVALTPERYTQAAVIWGGRIIKVENLVDHSEVEILAYPLNGAQEPQINDTGSGRFIALIPGYVERFDYPTGGLVTLRGRIQGVRSAHVGQAPYVFPLVKTRAAHVWSKQELRARRSHVNFGLGIGIGIH